MSIEDPLPKDDAPAPDDAAGPPRPGARPSSISIGTRSAWLRTGGTGEADEDPALARLRTVRLQPLGEGGQGRVFLVEHLGQLEAHKVVRRRGTDKSVFREALHTRLVEHPNIVKVFGTEEVDGNSVLRMEYVEGRDLARVVDEEGCLSVAEVLPYARQVAEALSAAHARGIVHQDLKPSNLILRADRSAVVVTDFGVSAALRSRASGANGRGGTPIFMAPELLEGRTSGTPRTDVWSLGVTLYFLVTGAYPFPFDELSPVEAVRADPRDPRAECPHVSEAFWSILLGALSRDPGDGFESMSAVADALRDYDERVTCPACSRRVARAAAGERCPEPDCRSPRAAKALMGAEALSAAEDALVRCEFEAARRAADRALAVAEDESAIRAEARRLRAAADGHAERHARAVREVTADLEEVQLVACLRKLDASRARFSRSPTLRDLRERLVQALVEVHESTASLATDELRRGEFGRAREILARLREICADPPARRALEQALGSGADDLGWLSEEVDRKEAVFERLSGETRAAIDAFDFETALRTLARLENEFPAEENVELLERLGRAQDAYPTACRIERERLVEIAADPLATASDEPLDLMAAAAACEELLSDFPPASYPAFREIAARKEDLAAASGALEERVATALTTAAELEGQRRLSEALGELRAVFALVVRSDLFGPGPRDELERRIARLGERLDRASRLYHDGVQARERREFAQAALAWREVGQLAPHDFPQIGHELSEIATLRDKVGALSERVTREFADLRRGRSAPETAELSFEHAEALYELADDGRRARLIADMAATLRVLLEERGRGLRAERDDLSPALTVVDALGFLVRGLDTERWNELFAADPELPAVIAAVPRAALDRGPTELEPLLADAGRLLLTFAELRAPLTHPAAGSADEHPGHALALRLARAFTSAPRPTQRARKGDAVATVRALAELVPPALEPDLRRVADRLRREGARMRSRRAVQLLGRLIVYAAPLVLVAWLAWIAGRDFGVQAEERDMRRLFASWLLRLDLDDAAQSEAHRWFEEDARQAAGFRAPTPERVALVQEWTELRSALADGTSDAELASWLALGRARRRDLLADGSSAALLRAFDQDVAAAVERRLSGLFERAQAELERELRHAATAGRALAGDLEQLRAALPSGLPSERRVAELLESLAGLVGGAVDEELRAALARGELVATLERHLDANRAVLADPDADAVARAAARYRIEELRRLVITAFVDLADRAALGEVEALSTRADALIRALETLPAGTGAGPRLGDGPGARAVDEVRRILRAGGAR